MLFSTPMVQALLKGSKTETRRLKGLEAVNLYPERVSVDWTQADPALIVGEDMWGIDIVKEATGLYVGFQDTEDGFCHAAKAPCQPGDVIWVRETFCEGDELTKYYYKADYHNTSKWKWKLSLFMPREACRIYLNVISVHAERLQDIYGAGAVAEGVREGLCQTQDGSHDLVTYQNYMANHQEFISAKSSYQTLWQSINGKASWELNPWVWVIKFEVQK